LSARRRARELLWFAGLWTLGVTVVAGVAYAMRWWLGIG
jgi:hypothetical protein